MKEIVFHTPKNIAFAQEIVKHLPQAIAKRLPADIAIVAVSAQESRALNRRYRKKDKATNVLSFRYGKEYGEIIVCPAVIRREAKSQKHAFEYQMTWYILHGMIHLSGLHHEVSASAAKKAEVIEQGVLSKLFKESRSKN